MKKDKVHGFENNQTRDGQTTANDVAKRVAIGAALFFLGTIVGERLASDRRRAAKISVSADSAVSIPHLQTAPDTPPAFEPPAEENWRQKYLSKAFWTKVLHHLSLDHKDPLAHFTKTLFGSVGVVFILEALSHWQPTSEAARTSLPLLTNHVHEIPASIVNISLAFAGVAAFARAFKWLDGVTKYAIAPLSEFTLHLYVIGIGASVAEQIVYAATHLGTAPFLAEPTVSLLWLCANALVIAFTIRLVIDAPEHWRPVRFSDRMVYSAVGLIVAGFFVLKAPFPSNIAWNNVFATKLPELKLKTKATSEE